MSTTPITSDSNEPRRPTARIVVNPTASALAPPANAPDRTLLVGDAPPRPSAADIDAAQPNGAATKSIFDQYAVLDRIGDGGMGVVFLARDRRLGRFAAIKRLNHQAQQNAGLRERFLQEAISVAALNHNNIVRVHGLGEDDDGAYLVMEYVEGPGERAPEGHGVAPPLTLEQAVTRDGQLPLPDALELALKLGRAIVHAHAQGVIHRDLKPANVLLDTAREPKIVDFGLARLNGPENKLTVPGEKLLSLGYGAPEQEQDASVSDERADVYGLGGILYFMLTGRNPRYFREQELPIGVREALTKALATDREQRWPTAAAFTDALAALQNRTHVEKPAVKNTWHCKWCDTVNTATTRHCVSCGWDGTEECPECSAEIFTGLQYCGACGADVRAYTTLHTVLHRIKKAVARRRHDDIPALAARAHGFEPAGPAGRNLLQEIRDLEANASRSHARREQLREQIPLELRAENYERADEFIREYRALSGNPQEFSDALDQLPALRAKRDCERARRAMRNREWERAERICSALMKQPGGRTPEAETIHRGLVARRRVRHALRVSLLLLLVAGLYLCHAPLLTRVAAKNKTVAIAVKPAAWFYEQRPATLSLARAYAGWWGVDASAFPSADNAQTPPPPPTADGAQTALRPTPDEAAEAAEIRKAHLARTAEIEAGIMAQLREEFTRQLAALDAGLADNRAQWPAQYIDDLKILIQRTREGKNVEPWLASRQELERFEAARELRHADVNHAHPELAALQNLHLNLLLGFRETRARGIANLAENCVRQLEETRNQLMLEDNMEACIAVNAEIQRLKNHPELLAALLLLNPVE